MKISALILAAGLSSFSAAALAQSSVPDPTKTPGALNPEVTQENIQSTICVPGWTRTVRPEMAYTQRLKRIQIAMSDSDDRDMRDYEEDHLIPLSLGGSPDDPRNLWPEPWRPADGMGADRKDELEAVLPRMVCKGEIGLADAQQVFRGDWREGWKRYVGGNGAPGRRAGFSMPRMLAAIHECSGDAQANLAGMLACGMRLRNQHRHQNDGNDAGLR